MSETTPETWRQLALENQRRAHCRGAFVVGAPPEKNCIEVGLNIGDMCTWCLLRVNADVLRDAARLLEETGALLRLKRLLRETYGRLQPTRLGKTICVQPDPAGSTFEFTEHAWSKEVREILGIVTEPDGS